MLKDLRKQIDEIDDEIVSLYLKRLKICQDIGKEKWKTGKSIADKNREADVIKRLTENLTAEEANYVTALYQTIFSESKRLQSSKKDENEKIRAALIGENVTKSFSKFIHELLGVSYDLQSVKKEELGSFLTSGKYNYFNVTMPYKRDVIPFLDEVSGTAKEIGVVNTVVVKNGKKSGYNTDIDGLRYIFTSNDVDVNGKNALVLGTGSTSKTATRLLQNLGAKSVKTVGRTSPINYENCYFETDTEIIINATPVGKNSYESLIDLKRFPNLKFVCDVIYSPLKTKLVLDAECLGVKAEGGLKMLVAQAVSAEELWQGKQFDLQKVYKKTLKAFQNIALVGMPSSGKTTIGRVLADKLNRKFIDIDSEIEKEQGKTIAEIFACHGEEYFRKLERETVAKFAYENGTVISLGGGAVTDEKNVTLIRQNSFVVYLDRDLSLLATDNRPMSKLYGNKALFDTRAKLYESACDVTVKNDCEIDAVVKKVINAYENFSN